jgi:hypothetical protein
MGKHKAKATRANSAWLTWVGQQDRHASARYQPDGSVYLYVPRDGRYWSWHTCYWVGVPEWARVKHWHDGSHWVAAAYAESAVSVLLAFYPEAIIS